MELEPSALDTVECDGTTAQTTRPCSEISENISEFTVYHSRYNKLLG